MAQQAAARNDKVSMSSGKEMISILLCGKIGTGKTSLVNGIMREKVAVEGSSATATTDAIKSYEDNFYVADIGKEVTVRLWDTPGLGNPFQDEDRLTAEIARYIKDANLVFFCLDMRHRLEKSDIEELEKLSREAGPDIWKCIIFVLTFAEQVTPGPTDHTVDKQKYFQKVMLAWQKALRTAMTKKLNIPEKLVREIPILPTGYKEKSPPDRQEWINPLKVTAFRKAQPTTSAILGTQVKYSEQTKYPTDKIIYLNASFPTYTLESTSPYRIAGMEITTGILGRVGAIILGAILGKVIVGGPFGTFLGFIFGAFASCVYRMASPSFSKQS